MRALSGIAFAVTAYLLLTPVAFARAIDVPEPSSLALILAGLGGLAIARYRKKR